MTVLIKLYPIAGTHILKVTPRGHAGASALHHGGGVICDAAKVKGRDGGIFQRVVAVVHDIIDLRRRRKHDTMQLNTQTRHNTNAHDA